MAIQPESRPRTKHNIRIKISFTKKLFEGGSMISYCSTLVSVFQYTATRGFEGNSRQGPDPV